MKTQHIIPLLLLVGCCAVSAQTTGAPTNTNTTTHAKTMSYTLRNLQNDKAILNPTDADIRTTMASLKDDFGPVLALEVGDGQPLVMEEVSKGKFGFTCQDGQNNKVTYAVKEGHECSSEVAEKIIISYRDGTADWKTLAEWKQLKM